MKVKLSLTQGVLTAAFILLTFLVTSVFDGTLLVTSLGASAFIVFSYPRAEAARPRYTLGGYGCAVVFGVIFSLLRQYVWPDGGMADVYFCVGAVFFTVLSMSLLSLGHPPSVALAITIVLTNRPFSLSAVALLSAAALCLFRLCFLWLAERADMDEELEKMLKKRPGVK